MQSYKEERRRRGCPGEGFEWCSPEILAEASEGGILRRYKEYRLKPVSVKPLFFLLLTSSFEKLWKTKKIKILKKSRAIRAQSNAKLPDFSGSKGTVAWLRPGVCDGCHGCESCSGAIVSAGLPRPKEPSFTCRRRHGSSVFPFIAIEPAPQIPLNSGLAVSPPDSMRSPSGYRLHSP
jgi:hypothetical protein